ncbi:hypothetical protein BKA62DRAFT_758845 [Auriculariales sp. MPI-PUGE-AT-0066]|nr:hypothetical protein BKA62DRAFT_758845 [Auriculariales sp. MPI-PUGE-AT-0066]
MHDMFLVDLIYIRALDPVRGASPGSTPIFTSFDILINNNNDILFLRFGNCSLYVIVIDPWKRAAKNGSDSDAGVDADDLDGLDKSLILPTGTGRRTRGKVVNYAALNADLGPDDEDDDDDSDDAPKKKKSKRNTKASPAKKLSSKMPNIGQAAKPSASNASPSRKKGVKKSRATIDSTDEEDEPVLDDDDDEDDAQSTGGEEDEVVEKPAKATSRGRPSKPASKAKKARTMQCHIYLVRPHPMIPVLSLLGLTLPEWDMPRLKANSLSDSHHLALRDAATSISSEPNIRQGVPMNAAPVVLTHRCRMRGQPSLPSSILENVFMVKLVLSSWDHLSQRWPHELFLVSSLIRGFCNLRHIFLQGPSEAIFVLLRDLAKGPDSVTFHLVQTVAIAVYPRTGSYNSLETMLVQLFPNLRSVSAYSTLGRLIRPARGLVLAPVLGGSHALAGVLLSEERDIRHMDIGVLMRKSSGFTPPIRQLLDKLALSEPLKDLLTLRLEMLNETRGILNVCPCDESLKLPPPNRRPQEDATILLARCTRLKTLTLGNNARPWMSRGLLYVLGVSRAHLRELAVEIRHPDADAALRLSRFLLHVVGGSRSDGKINGRRGKGKGDKWSSALRMIRLIVRAGDGTVGELRRSELVANAIKDALHSTLILRRITICIDSRNSVTRVVKLLTHQYLHLRSVAEYWSDRPATIAPTSFLSLLIGEVKEPDLAGLSFKEWPFPWQLYRRSEL